MGFESTTGWNNLCNPKSSDGCREPAWIPDDKLAQDQRDALMEILTGRVGGLFSMLSVNECKESLRCMMGRL